MGEAYTLRLSAEEIDRYRRTALAAAAAEADLWVRAGVVVGADVVDVGCGPGAFLPLLAERVGERGSVTGVDADDDARARAGALLAASSHRARVAVRAGTATATGIAPASCDVAFVRNVLAHNGGAEQEIVDHAASLLRPGGALLVVDVEMTMVRLRPPVAPIVELYERYHALHARRGNDLQVGLRLGELLETAGLEVEHFEGWVRPVRRSPGMRGPAWAAREAMVAEGIATEDDVRRWEEGFRALDAAPVQPLWFLTGMRALGRRRA